jgi:prepilin-type N-terminal cleavage/methylation domain-containing protein
MTNKGFTLIELSITIILVGIITAGVLGGRNIIEQTRLQQQITEFQEIKLAYEMFKSQFKAIPGDFIASKYWPGAPDGNGNTQIDGHPDHEVDVDTERLIFFTHLSLAKFLDKNYNNTSVLGEGYPELLISKGKGMSIGKDLHAHANFQRSTIEEFRAGLHIQIGVPDANLSFKRNDHHGTASPRTYHLIDTKIDDGFAISGNFRAYKVWLSYFGDCLTAMDGEYLLSNDRVACHAFYIFEE